MPWPAGDVNNRSSGRDGAAPTSSIHRDPWATRLDPRRGNPTAATLEGALGAAQGQLHEFHKVHYSLSRAGKYLLHVRLQNDTKPLAGSPFALTVHLRSSTTTSARLAASETPRRRRVAADRLLAAGRVQMTRRHADP